MKALTPGEIAVHHVVTVLERIDADPSYRETDLFGRTSDRGHPLVGVPLTVRAVDLPFVFVDTCSGGHAVLDTRMVRVMELKPEFVAAFQRAVGPRETACDDTDAHNRLSLTVTTVVLPKLQHLEQRVNDLAAPPRRPWWRRLFRS